jgi:diacylglycerol kinase (ATP)
VSEPFCLVVNPAAGGGRSLRYLPLATVALDAAGAAYSVSESASLEHAAELAAAGARSGHVVVAVGGDGLAGALAGVVATASGTYGIIPAGRGNDLARVLAIPADPAAAVRVLTSGQTRQIDLIGVSAPGRAECIVAGSVYAGIPSVAGQIANATRWVRGPAVYPLAALRALAGWKPATFRVEIGAGRDSASADSASGDSASGDSASGDSASGHAAVGSDTAGISQAAVHEFAGYAVVVANSAYFGAGMLVAPPARIDDGILDVVLMGQGPKLAFVRALMKIRDGSHVSLPQISLDRGAEVTMTIDREMSAAADGETIPGAAQLAAGVPLRIRALPSILTVLAPQCGSLT